MTRTRVNLLIAGGLLVGLTACGSANRTTVSSIVPDTSVVPAAVSSTTAWSAASSSTSSAVTTVAGTSSTVASKSVNPPTATAAPAPKPDLSGVLALVDSAEKSGAGVDKELNTATNAMNSPEQDPQS